MHLALVTAAEPVMCNPECLSSKRAFAASCHVQPLLTRVSEVWPLFTAYFPALETLASLLALVFQADHRQGLGSGVAGRKGSRLSEGCKDYYRGQQWNSSLREWSGWDFSLQVDCCWFCCQLTLAECTSCQGSQGAVSAATNPPSAKMRCPRTIPWAPWTISWGNFWSYLDWTQAWAA